MQKKKSLAILVFILTIFFQMSTNLTNVSAAEITLREGMSGSTITTLQRNLNNLGFLKVKPTGYFGDLTTSAVKKLQHKYKLKEDGVVGKSTKKVISTLVANRNNKVNRGSILSREKSALTTSSNNKDVAYLKPWFGGVDKLFSRGGVAEVYDIDTGLSFKVKRTFGTNHADCEPLTSKDTEIMKKIYGGDWSWQRRAIIVTVDGNRIAGSMNGMPHAGIDSKPDGSYQNSRSAGYGNGINFDSVKGNNMDGHFCIHFLGSKTHGSNTVDKEHQEMIKKAAQYAQK